MNRIQKPGKYKVGKKMVCGLMIYSLAASNISGAWASSVSKAEKEKKQAEQNLDSAKQKVNDLENDKKAASNKLEALNHDLSEILNTIQVLENDLTQKQGEIDQAEIDYAEARTREEKQYLAMKKRIKYIYEAGETQYLDILLQSRNLTDLMNKSEYIYDIYEYDKNMLNVYQETKLQVAQFKEELLGDKDDLLAIEEEQVRQKADLETLIAKKKKEVSNFSTQLADAKKNAETYAKSVKEQTARLKKMKDEEAKKVAEEARKAEAARKASSGKNSSKPSGGVSNIASAVTGPGAKSTGGTERGRAIANYGLQFVGNPYVFGGTSLTKGADCSGFTQSVFRNFGISLPRTSSEQSRVGQAVDFGDIQPGDLVFYAGHVAISIGGGRIVHASTAKTGIKVSSVTYRTILGIRRAY